MDAERPNRAGISYPPADETYSRRTVAVKGHDASRMIAFYRTEEDTT